jgi:predicted Rossmann fold flavoprotein
MIPHARIKKDVAIIGGGAAGLMCAIEAGKRGRSVVVLERNERLGKKILISGGGRCNFTNLHATPENYSSSQPDFCKSALARYTPSDFISLVEKHGVSYHEKKLGQLFCDFSSREIVDLLKKECDAVNAQIRLSSQVSSVQKRELFVIETNQGSIEASSLVVATGGLSFPQIGATDFGHNLAKQFGHTLIPLQPGLVPLIFQKKEQALFKQLSGISVDAKVSCNGISFRENLLFTHRGLSGPVILQISSYWHEGDAITIDLLPDQSATEIFKTHQQSNMELSNVLYQFLPRRFVQLWTPQFAASQPIKRYSPPELAKIAHQLHHWEVTMSGTEGYPKAEVTIGGVDTLELSSKTMESRKIPGLYFIGEVVDVTGWLGGYNFQWAWASGHAAGQFV